MIRDVRTVHIRPVAELLSAPLNPGPIGSGQIGNPGVVEPTVKPHRIGVAAGRFHVGFALIAHDFGIDGCHVGSCVGAAQPTDADVFEIIGIIGQREDMIVIRAAAGHTGRRPIRVTHQRYKFQRRIPRGIGISRLNCRDHRRGTAGVSRVNDDVKPLAFLPGCQAIHPLPHIIVGLGHNHVRSGVLGHLQECIFIEIRDEILVDWNPRFGNPMRVR